MNARIEARTRGDSPWVLYELSKFAMISFELIGYRFRRSGLGTFLAIGEPVAVVVAFTFIQSIIIKRPPFGTSIALFYATGIIPFYLFLHTTIRFRQWDLIPRYPQVSELELIFAQITAELVSKIMIQTVVCGALFWNGTPDAVPIKPIDCLEAMIFLALFGSAFGVVNNVIANFFPPWNYIYQVGIRAWMAFSGVLLVVDVMPQPMREAAAWVPVTHAVTLYRSGQYLRYPSMTLDMSYLIESVFFMIVFAFLFENATRRWRDLP